jgi:hypothetical protein
MIWDSSSRSEGPCLVQAVRSRADRPIPNPCAFGSDAAQPEPFRYRVVVPVEKSRGALPHTPRLAGEAGSGAARSSATSRSHPVSCPRRTRNLPARQGLASLGLSADPCRAGRTRVRAEPRRRGGKALDGGQTRAVWAKIHYDRFTTNGYHKRRHLLSSIGKGCPGEWRKNV